PAGALSGVGDVNGDGLADVLVSPSPSSQCCTPSAFVLHGRRSGARVVLGDHVPDAMPVLVDDADRCATTQVSNAVGLGDVNGDGLGDLALAMGHMCGLGGRVWVVFGAKSDRQLRTSKLGDRGFAVVGSEQEQLAGYGIPYAGLGAPGDVDGDG